MVTTSAEQDITAAALAALADRLRTEGILEYLHAEKPFAVVLIVTAETLTSTASAVHRWLDTNGLGHFVVAASFMPQLGTALVSVSESINDFKTRAVAVARKGAATC